MYIREFHTDEINILKLLTVSAFEGVCIDHAIEDHFGTVAGTDWKWRKSLHIDDDLTRPNAAIFVAVDDDSDEVIGYVSTHIDYPASTGFIANLAVHEHHRNAGIGRRLIEYALAHFRNQNLELARIETLAHNPVGNHLYPSCGFTPVCQQVHFAQRLS